ncbi:peptidase M20 [Croceibacterium mercuriale]|uniref:Peptidase M20 n=1 Tax=Croceibacterium mercuriale TaxID=1572751 RepID=A0A0B2BVH8_9SPHN|nr:M20/M25/M40 family metallo-hydrolase [Croceibacterium mercuriale]KHL25628.1 peptidase M20 [Croceibacterium mercuriale]
MRHILASAFLLATGLPGAPAAAARGEAEFRALLTEAVAIDTSAESGSCTPLAELTAQRLREGGLPAEDVHVFVPEEDAKAGIVVATYPGTDAGAAPLLLVGHLDVVNARREDWTRDPFTLFEEDGVFYGRGVADMKAQNAIWIDTLLRFAEEGHRPRRTVKLALTCGEEGSGFVNGASWLVEHQRDLIDAGMALNEGGYGELTADGVPVAQTFQAAQKVVMSFQLEVTNPGGHSSVPRPDNAIYSLARALDRIGHHEFPVQFIDANRAYFTQMADVVGGEAGAAMRRLVADPGDGEADRLLSANPSWHTMLRTTCVATMLTGGHAPNALPQRARAHINCRVLPGVDQAAVLAALVAAVDDPEVAVEAVGTWRPMEPAPVTEALLAPARAAAEAVWPGVPVVPYLAPGATDAVALTPAGIPTYGVTGLFRDPDNNGVHGLNERLRVKSVMDGRRFLYALVKAYAE